MQKAVNKNISIKAQELLDFLSETAGKKIITGQHTQTNEMEEIDYIKSVTLKEPLLRGFELLAYSPNINYSDASKECLKEVYENRDTLKTALKWAKNSNGILTFSFHWFSPLYGHDKSFYAENTEFNPDKILIENTKERKAFYHDMDVIAEELKVFRDEDIPILFRPFHESDGKWFWWGRNGEKTAMKLYKLMYDYYTNVHNLNNLLWVWNCRLKDGYPGDDFVDIISVDIYMPEYKKTSYRDEYLELIKNTTDKKTAALAEVGYIPDVDCLKKDKTPWAYYMTWSKEFCIGEKYNTKENLKSMYDSDYSIKL